MTDSTADFHAAGRHTHITELLRNGVSIPEARELARHSDVRQTMKYTHIGIEDQAKALSKLPWQRTSAGDESSDAGKDDGAQRSDSATRRPNGHPVSSTGNKTVSENENPKNKNPCMSRGYDAARRDVAPSGTEGASLVKNGGGGNRTRRSNLVTPK